LEVNGGRAISSSAGLSSLLHEGGKDLQVFHPEVEAVQWMNQLLGTRHGNAPPVIIRSAEAAGAPSEGLPEVALAAGTDRSSRGPVVVLAMGNDPSVSDPTCVNNTLIHGQAEMIDIMVLPGRSKHSESAASTDIAMLAKLWGTEQGVTKHRQTNRLQAYFKSLSYFFTSVQWYLSSGLLSTMVVRSFEFF
jgi:hypothetical protein